MSGTLAGAQQLQQALKTARCIVTVGSGGVGKTTTAAALAIAGGRQGRRCAVLTIDPAKRLAQALGLEKLGNNASALPAELVSPGSVDAMMLETADAFDDLVTRLVPDQQRRERLLSNRLYQTLARHLSGTHEYMAVEKLFHLTEVEKYDLVVLDTPPSVNALDFLGAPERLVSFFSEKVQRFFVTRKETEAKRRGIISKLKDRVGEVAMSVLGKALGDEFIDDVQDFATAFQGLFDAFRERGAVVKKLLTDPQTSFLVISGADPVRVAEALEFARTLEGMGISPQVYVANRVHVSATDALPKITDEAVAEALNDKVDSDTIRILTDGLSQAQRVRAALATRDRQGLLEMAKTTGKDRLIVVPELAEEVQDRSAVEHVLKALGCSDNTP